MLLEENERGSVHFKDIDWRLNLVTATRQRQKMLLPKYTMRLQLEKHAEMSSSASPSDEKTTVENLVVDLDYTNMKRL